MLWDFLELTVSHALHHYEYESASFLAERIHASNNSKESIYLLASCYYRRDQLYKVYSLFKQNGCPSPPCKFLMARTCYQLRKYEEAEIYLSGDVTFRKDSVCTEDIIHEFGPSAPFALKLLADIYRKCSRVHKASELYRHSLKLNPFLWASFTALGDLGEIGDAEAAFSLPDTLSFCIPDKLDRRTVPVATSQLPSLTGLVDPLHCSSSNTTAHQASFKVPSNSFSLDPLSNLEVRLASEPSSDGQWYTPLPQQRIGNCAAVSGADKSYVALKPLDMSPSAGDSEPQAGDGAHEDSGGIVTRRQSRIAGGLKSNKHLFTSAPPSFESDQEVSPMVYSSFNAPPTSAAATALVTPSDKCDLITDALPKAPVKKNKPAEMSRIAVAVPVLSSNVFTQNNNRPLTGGTANQTSVSSGATTNNSTNRAPVSMDWQGTGTGTVSNQIAAGLRRSSRIHNINNQLKENSKAGGNKSLNSKLISRRGSRTSKLPSKLATNYPNKPCQTISDSMTSTPATSLPPHHAAASSTNQPPPPPSQVSVDADQRTELAGVNLVTGRTCEAAVTLMDRTQAQAMLSLLKLLGSAYCKLCEFECAEALATFSSLPTSQYRTAWVLRHVARAHFERAHYREAEKVFAEMRYIEPHALEGLDIYSTNLFHLGKETELSALAQDAVQMSKQSPYSWCAAGNCFALQREHETAIKFFQRAIQVSPEFEYAYTLLGHEYMAIEELDKALSCYRTAISLNPRHYNAWYGLGNIYYKQEKFKQAEFYFKRALLIKKNCSILLCHIALVQHAQLHTTSALQLLNKAITLEPHVPLCKFHKASILFSIDRHDEALSILSELKQEEPRESLLYFLTGKIYKKKGLIHLALMNFSWAMDLDPKGANSQIKEAIDKKLIPRSVTDIISTTVDQVLEQNLPEELVE